MASSLGRIAFGIVGALIGAPFGLAAVGFAIGSAIGGLLFAPDNSTSIEGPRLGDTDVQASSLGKIIPRHYGVIRTGGNIFWSGGLKETKIVDTQSQGKGGGSSSTSTTYSYSASFASALGRGPAEAVLRIWADGKLIYDATGAGDIQNDKYSFRLRTGVDTQPIDPLIEESINRRLQGLPDVNEGNGPQAEYKNIDDLIAEATASTDPRSAIYVTYLTALKAAADLTTTTPKQYNFTPSYKEFCYLLFDDMPLEDFGNRIPNITAEIVFTADIPVPANNTVTETAITEISAVLTVPTEAMGVDSASESLVALSGTQIRKFSFGLLTETAERSGVQIITPTSGSAATATVESVLCADAAGTFIARIGRIGGETTQFIGKIAPASLDILGGLTDSGAHYVMPDVISRTIEYACSGGQNGTRTLIATCGPLGEFYVLQTDTDTVTVEWGGGIGGTFVGAGAGPMARGASSPGDTKIYWLADDTVNWTLYEIEILFGAGSTNVPTVNTSILESGVLAGGSVSSVFYDFSSGSVFTLVAELAGDGTIRRYDPEATGGPTDPFLQYAETLTLSPPNPKSGFQRSGVTTGKIAYAEGLDVAEIDLSDGSEFLYTGVLSDSASPDTQIYNPSAASLVTWLDDSPFRIQLQRLTYDLFSTDLATVLSAICTDVGMAADEFTVTDIVGQHTVRGYSIARAVTGRKAMENLLQAYYVDGIENDWILRFQNRTTTPVRTILEDELGATKVSTGMVPWQESRQPEYDLPREISMIYTDVDRDYQQGSAHKRRTSAPVPSMYAAKNQTVEMPAVFNEIEARDIAERLLYLAWMSRDTAKGKLPWTHLDLDPTDVVQFSFADGTRILTDRIAKTDVGANFEIDVITVRSGDPVYVSAAAAEVTTGVPGTSIITPVFSKMFVFDIPLLEDYHDVARSSQRYYAAVGSETTAWLSADLYDSVDNASFANFDTAVVDVTWGQIIGDPLGTPRALWTTDRENSITVGFSVDNGDVTSVTRDDIINSGANRALIWNQSTGVAEIIQFQTVVLNGDGTKTLSVLTRGLRGTDYTVDQHSAGEYLIMVNDTSILPELNTLGLIGTTKYYKAVSRGSLLAAAQSVAVPTIGRDLMPYAPGQFRRTDDGTDLTVLWNRRTRLGGQWNMVGTGIEPVPLNEDSEAYEFYVLPNTPTAVADFDPNSPATFLQLQSIGVEQAIVLAADLVTFGYTLIDDINVAVYQLSAQVGRGFPRVAALPA